MGRQKTKTDAVPARPKNGITSTFVRYPELRKLFLKHLARYGNFAGACRYVRVHPGAVAYWLGRTPEFAQQVEDAKEEHRSKIERAVHDRAIVGWDEPKFSASGQIGVVRRYSDTLLLAYARRHIKEYRDSQPVANVSVDGKVKHDHEHVHRVDPKVLSQKQRDALRLLLGTREEEQPPPDLPKITVTEVSNGTTNGEHKNGTNGHHP